MKRIKFPRPRRWEYASEDGVTVSTRGVPAVFRGAFLRGLVETRNLYRRCFGRHTIDRVEFNVRRDPQLQHRLWTNGADRVYLTLPTPNQLLPFPMVGVRNVHGLAHELAHIVMYRMMINISALPDGWGEGWAVYIGAFVGVPHLHEVFGPDLWPYPYDYLSTDGPPPFLRRLADPKAVATDPTLKAMEALRRLDTHLGRRDFLAFLRGLLKVPLVADEFVKSVRAAVAKCPRAVAPDTDRGDAADAPRAGGHRRPDQPRVLSRN